MEQPLRARDLPQSVPVSGGRPLVIELEGALLRSNLVYEAIFSNAAGSLNCFFGAIRRRADKPLEHVWTEAQIDYTHLPHEPEVLTLALAARAQGVQIYLAAARFSDHAAAIAAHLGFDGVVAVADVLAGAVTDNADPRSIAFEAGHFDYVGSERTPGEIWSAAATTYVVGEQNSLVARLKRSISAPKEIGHHGASWRTWLNALRVHQYAKNALVFVPALTSHQINWTSLGNALLAFLAFSACASSAYLLNDLLDLAADRQHPTKRHRAIASGALSISLALTAIPLLWILSAVLGLCLSAKFLAVLGAYLAITVCYSLYLKKKMLVDIMFLAALYSMRIFGGAIAIGVYVSEWLMIFSLFIFTSLALIKRYSELAMRQELGLANPANRDYRISDLQIVGAMAAASGMNAITVLSLYVSSPAVAQMYSRPWMLWLLNPLLLYWIGRALMLAHRRAMPDDPIVYTFKDGASRMIVLAMTCVVLAAI